MVIVRCFPQLHVLPCQQLRPQMFGTLLYLCVRHLAVPFTTCLAFFHVHIAWAWHVHTFSSDFNSAITPCGKWNCLMLVGLCLSVASMVLWVLLGTESPKLSFLKEKLSQIKHLIVNSLHRVWIHLTQWYSKRGLGTPWGVMTWGQGGCEKVGSTILACDTGLSWE